MNKRIGFFEHDRRRCIDTRLTEILAGGLSIVYGAKATQSGLSEFQQVVQLKEYAYEWGIGVVAVGILMIIFASSRFHWIRFMLALCLFVGWAGIVVLFLSYRLGGIPLWNGMMLMGVSVAVMITILTHEKHRREADHRMV